MIRGKYAGPPAVAAESLPQSNGIDPNTPRPTIDIRTIEAERGVPLEAPLPPPMPDPMPVQPQGFVPIQYQPPEADTQLIVSAMQARVIMLRQKLAEAKRWETELATLERMLQAGAKDG